MWTDTPRWCIQNPDTPSHSNEDRWCTLTKNKNKFLVLKWKSFVATSICTPRAKIINMDVTTFLLSIPLKEEASGLDAMLGKRACVVNFSNSTLIWIVLYYFYICVFCLFFVRAIWCADQCRQFLIPEDLRVGTLDSLMVCCSYTVAEFDDFYNSDRIIVWECVPWCPTYSVDGVLCSWSTKILAGSNRLPRSCYENSRTKPWTWTALNSPYKKVRLILYVFFLANLHFMQHNTQPAQGCHGTTCVDLNGKPDFQSATNCRTWPSVSLMWVA